MFFAGAAGILIAIHIGYMIYRIASTQRWRQWMGANNDLAPSVAWAGGPHQTPIPDQPSAPPDNISAKVMIDTASSVTAPAARRVHGYAPYVASSLARTEQPDEFEQASLAETPDEPLDSDLVRSVPPTESTPEDLLLEAPESIENSDFVEPAVPTEPVQWDDTPAEHIETVENVEFDQSSVEIDVHTAAQAEADTDEQLEPPATELANSPVHATETSETDNQPAPSDDLERPTDAIIQATERSDDCHVTGDSSSIRSATLYDLLEPKLELVRNNKLSILTIDSQGELSKRIESELASETHPELAQRLVSIDIASPSNAGLFNPFRVDLAPSNDLQKQRLLNEAFEIECFVLEAVLSPEITQDHRSELRHLMRLLHALPNPDLETLLRLSAPSEFEEFSKYVPKISSASSRRFFSNGYIPKDQGKLSDHINTRLKDLLSDAAFKEATSACASEADPIQQFGTGRIISLKLEATDFCPAKAAILKRTLMANMVLAMLSATASSSIPHALIFCIDDVSECFGDKLSEFELIFNHVRNLGGQILLGQKSADQ